MKTTLAFNISIGNTINAPRLPNDENRSVDFKVGHHPAPGFIAALDSQVVA
jgi:hypothetical protein